jgi:hypothetical protein
MLCALTVRTLKPGTVEQFREAFTPDEVICFGFFDELRRGAAESECVAQLDAVAALVESVAAVAMNTHTSLTTRREDT